MRRGEVAGKQRIGAPDSPKSGKQTPEHGFVPSRLQAAAWVASVHPPTGLSARAVRETKARLDSATMHRMREVRMCGA
jgi:hypothetical protein